MKFIDCRLILMVFINSLSRGQVSTRRIRIINDVALNMHNWGRVHQKQFSRHYRHSCCLIYHLRTRNIIINKHQSKSELANRNSMAIYIQRRDELINILYKYTSYSDIDEWHIHLSSAKTCKTCQCQLNDKQNSLLFIKMSSASFVHISRGRSTFSFFFDRLSLSYHHTGLENFAKGEVIELYQPSNIWSTIYTSVYCLLK